MLATQLITFQTTTATHSKVKARGSNMLKIDQALGAYWGGIPTATAHQEILLLTGVVNACKEWLKTKYTKSEYQKTIFGTSNYFNVLFVTRKTEVTRLGNEALDELYARLQAHGVINADLKGQIKFDKHKLTALGSRTGQRPVLKPMGNDYQPERTSYLNSGKTQALSGSGAHAVHHSIQAYQTPALMSHNMGTGTDMTKKALKVAKKNINSLTVEDFSILDTIGRANLMSGDLTYLKKAERFQYMLIPDGLGNLCDYNDNLVTTNPLMVTAYAMDKYGNLISKDAGTINGAFFFNHSSFNAGHDVISAGTLTITNGVLQSIDNNSGHYKPTRTNLFNCIDVLVSEGVDITHAIVNLYVWVHNVKQEHRYNATSFHANPNSHPDIHIV